MSFDQITLKNGLRIIGEHIEHFRSVSVGFWVGSGSQYETPEEAGLSHFLEHMVFKGTKKRNTRQIAEEMDRVGGQLNAFTSKECTCFYAKVVDEHLELAMDVLSDLVTAPIFDPKELEKEKGVVIEEIGMSADDPEDYVHELLMLAHYGSQPIARPILGTEEKIAAYSANDLRTYWKKMYRPQNTVLAIAGHYDWNQVVEIAEKLLSDWSADGFETRTVNTQPYAASMLFKEKDNEQIHICLGYPGLKIGSEQGYELSLFSSVFGGAMSSRLFQKIREERGAAYSVYSYPNAYTDSGMLSVYAGTNPDSAAEVYALLLEEARKMAEEGMTRDEFIMAREQLKSGFILGLESTGARMQSLGRRLLLLGNTRTETEVIDRVNAIDFDSVNALAHRILSAPHSVALVGKNAEAVAKSIHL